MYREKEKTKEFKKVLREKSNGDKIIGKTSDPIRRPSTGRPLETWFRPGSSLRRETVEE